MPKVSEFYGIAVYFYYREHGPPHFHAIYGEHEAQIDIAALRILEGHLPTRALRLVAEWAKQHQNDLARAWDQARAAAPLDPIEPLE